MQQQNRSFKQSFFAGLREIKVQGDRQKIKLFKFY